MQSDPTDHTTPTDESPELASEGVHNDEVDNDVDGDADEVAEEDDDDDVAVHLRTRVEDVGSGFQETEDDEVWRVCDAATRNSASRLEGKGWVLTASGCCRCFKNMDRSVSSALVNLVVGK